MEELCISREMGHQIFWKDSICGTAEYKTLFMQDVRWTNMVRSEMVLENLGKKRN